MQIFVAITISTDNMIYICLLNIQTVKHNILK